MAHGFRSSFRDRVAEETNDPREVIEAALPHVVQNKVEAANARRHNRAEPRRTTSFPCGGNAMFFDRTFSSCPGLGAHSPTPHQNLWVYRTFEDSRRSSV